MQLRLKTCASHTQVDCNRTCRVTLDRNTSKDIHASVHKKTKNNNNNKNTNRLNYKILRKKNVKVHYCAIHRDITRLSLQYRVQNDKYPLLFGIIYSLWHVTRLRMCNSKAPVSFYRNAATLCSIKLSKINKTTRVPRSITARVRKTRSTGSLRFFL